MVDSQIKVRQMTRSDIDRVVNIHMDAFEGFFLASLGPRFLKVFYSAAIEDPTGINILASSYSGIFGFVIGTTTPKMFYRRLLVSKSVEFLWAALPSLVKNPRNLPHLLRSISLPREAARPKGFGTLLTIAVAKEGQNLGIGHLLITAFIDEAVKRGLNKINLFTDKDHNDPVNNFYIKHGFRIDHSFKTPEGRWMNEYVIDLSPVGDNY